ncbi:MAG: SGNH/GDSL hydrolase family protein [Woeseia sp.]
MQSRWRGLLREIYQADPGRYVSYSHRLFGGMRRLIGWYQSGALIIVNTIVLFLLLNLFLLGFFHVKDRLSGDSVVAEKYGFDLLMQGYPHRSEQEVRALLSETWSRKFVYEPFTQFTESPYRGEYVNVDEAGFRFSADQGPWPPQSGAINVFVFGGSTAFGYGVADDETIASYLQARLASQLDATVRVYNFGRGHYYSTQERVLFTQLLANGHAPDLAVFIDGLNDFYYAKSDEPLYTRRLRRVTQDPGSRALELLSQSPLARVIGRQAVAETVDYDDPVIIQRAIDRYLSNRSIIEAVAASREVQPVFVWQPVPTFAYDQGRHPFSLASIPRHLYSRQGYRSVQTLNEQGRLGEDFLWCAEIHDDAGPEYVDVVHYSARFSERIAACISDLIFDRGLLAVSAQPGHGR